MSMGHTHFWHRRLEYAAADEEVVDRWGGKHWSVGRVANCS